MRQWGARRTTASLNSRSVSFGCKRPPSVFGPREVSSALEADFLVANLANPVRIVFGDILLDIL
jgi:hypothetical protein